MEPKGGERIIDLLVSQEKMVGGFYRLCATKFPERSDLWLWLATVEDKHAELLQGIAADAAASEVFSRRRNFALSPLRIMLDFVRKQTEMLHGHGFSLATALAVSRDIENSILEKRVLEHYRGDPDDISAKIDQIRDETIEHRDKILAVLTEVMKGSGR